MSDQTTDVRGAVESNDPRWLGDSDVMDAALPAEFQAAMGTFLGEDVETLDGWVDRLRELTGGSIGVSELCHADSETPHRATMNGDTYHFQCFYDAVALASIEDESVDIRTESPEGDVITARATPNGVEATPGDAVTSFGVAAGASPSGDEPTLGESYGAICPYVKAFPDREAYEAWASTVDAETVALPLTDGFPVAGALVE
jgi:alkylmercury lyase